MLPLGGFWSGVCEACSHEGGTPDEGRLLRSCNLGYARGQCPRFPDDSDRDAVRFTISRDDGESLALYYVVERDHNPVAHGPLEYSRPTRSFKQLQPGDRFSRQAQAYVDSYLRRIAHGR